MKTTCKPPVSQFAQLFADFFPPAPDAAKAERIRLAKKFLAEKTAADKQRAIAAALAEKAIQDARDPWSDFDRLAELMARVVRPVTAKSRFSGVTA